MLNNSTRAELGRFVGRAVTLALPLVFLLAGCGTTITSSEKLSDSDPAGWWTKRSTLPVELHGTLPGDATAELASLFPPRPNRRYASSGPMVVPNSEDRIVLYVNAGTLPQTNALCSQSETFRDKDQTDAQASVTAALCHGTETIAQATGRVPVIGQSKHNLKESFGTLEDALFDVLQPPEPNISNGA